MALTQSEVTGSLTPSPRGLLASSRIANLYRSSVGKKQVMALTGMAMLFFVIAHMLGNLKIYFGPEEFNLYAEHLREIGLPILTRTMALWMVRFLLLACTVLHIVAAIQVTRQSQEARPVGYRRNERLSFSYASYTMRWGGVVILAFVIYHILHLTLGVVHGPLNKDVYENVVSGFKNPIVSLAYIAANVVLGFHLYHGLWSAFQTLGINNPKYNKWRRPTALGVALAIVIGNVSIPVSVMTGIVRSQAATLPVPQVTPHE